MGLEGAKKGWTLGWAEKAFLGALSVLAVLEWAGQLQGLRMISLLACSFFGVLVLTRLGLLAMRRAIWRLRDRLMVTYVFIAVVPLVLLSLFAELGAWALSSQIGVFLLNAEMDRRMNSLRMGAESLAHSDMAMRKETLSQADYLRGRYPGLEILIRDDRGAELRYPESSSIKSPPKGFGETSGIVIKDGRYHIWAHSVLPGSEVVLVMPVTKAFLQGLVPHIGDVTLINYSGRDTHMTRIHPPIPGEPHAEGGIPPAANFLDVYLQYGVQKSAAVWESPQSQTIVMLGMRTRISGIFNLLFNQESWRDQQSLLEIVIGAAVIAVFVVLLAVFVGISLTRAITDAVQKLYEGTERVREGDLAHRIEVRGQDQLADLGHSFNAMTENLERLLKSEKERQRLQAELEIAREVQAQLHPKGMPKLKSLSLASVCDAARMVSGDYYDYQQMSDHTIALAIGDIAGKGISAALLMATLQSAMRSQLRHCQEIAALGGDGLSAFSTAKLVSNLNQQIYASTAPEKYATFFFSIYDDQSGVLTYTNAGHLSPLLVRNGEVILLDSNGTVVGAFPRVPYNESQIRLESGDLLVCYTDGITEPENEYGEMFGEERLIEVVKRNCERDSSSVADAVVRAVRDWTSSPELQDDMTLVVARKV